MRRHKTVIFLTLGFLVGICILLVTQVTSPLIGWALKNIMQIKKLQIFPR